MLHPKYAVLSVIYAPPGTAASSSSSYVSYGQGFAMGTSTSVTRSFKTELQTKVTASTGVELLGTGGQVSVGVSAGYAATSSKKDVVDVKLTTTRDFRLPGGNLDGINHDGDLILLWLNPAVSVTFDGPQTRWSLGVKTPPNAPVILEVYVGWLRVPSTMPANIASTLSAYRITPDDYPVILQSDPFASGSTTIDSSRFVPTDFVFSYLPPGPTGAIAGSTGSVKHDSSQVSATSAAVEISVGVSVSAKASVDFIAKISAEMSASSTWRWTNSNESSRSTATSQTATVYIAGSSAAYRGSPLIAVYWDTIYSTFMFAPLPDPTPTVRGVVLDAGRRPQRNVEVVLTGPGFKRRTFTTSDGRYVFGGTPTGSGTIEVRGLKRATLLRRGAAPKVDFILAR